MTIANKNLKSAAVGAVVTLLCSATFAADESGDAEALTAPTNSIEINVLAPDAKSFKFAEYNGLKNDKAYLDGSIEVRGGGRYDSDDPTRWRLSLWDLGLPTAGGLAEIGQQGKFRLSVGFDTLRHYPGDGDSYNTIYGGAGSNALTLPSSWVIPVVPRLSTTSANARGLLPAVTSSNALVSGVSTAPTAAQLAQAAAVQAADVPAFKPFAISTTRHRYDAGLTAVTESKWEFSVNARRETREGSKMMSTVTRSSGGDIATLLPDPISQRTEQLTAMASWHDSQRSFMQMSYSASAFTNDIRSVSWQNWALPTATSTMSSAPSNKSYQFAFSGGRQLLANTRLSGSMSRTMTSQDQSFLTDVWTPLVPRANLGGQVETSMAAIKLNSRLSKALSVNAGYTYDYRDNQTAVATYGYYDTNEAIGTAALDANFAAALGLTASQLASIKSNININANRPYSRKRSEWYADVNYQLVPGHSLTVGFNAQQLDRFCKGSWIACADAASTKEDTYKLDWAGNWADDVHSRLSYAYGDRKVDAYNENAFLAVVPMANVAPTGATMSAWAYMKANGLTGWGPALGYTATTGDANLFFPLNNALANAMYRNQNRISELPGMRRYNMASRKRDKARGQLDWQATATLALQGSVDYANDKFSDSRYGLVGERDTAANFEAQFNPSETVGVVFFYTHERQEQDANGKSYTANSNTANVSGFTAISGGCYSTILARNNNNKLDKCTDWSTNMSTTSNIYGLTLDLKGLMSNHKLDLALDAVATRSTTTNVPVGGNYVNNPLAVTGATGVTYAAFYIPATALPEVYANSVEVKFSAKYAVGKNGTMKLGYLYGHYTSQDYAYDGLQFGGLAGVLPTLQVAPQYTVNLVSLGYSTRF